MSIIQVPIQELITNLISNAGNLTNNTNQAENAGMFGSLMKDLQALDTNGTIASPVLREIIIKSIQNSEVSEQIKTALASGGMVSLGINNPKDTLNSLLQISQELNSILSPENNQQQPLSINIEKLLDSMQIKDVVVDNQVVSQVVEKFLEQIEDLFKNIIQIADNKEIANTGELVKLLKEIKSELKSELSQLFDKDNKQIVIDLSKIKILLPEDETKKDTKTENLTPINLIIQVINMESTPIVDDNQTYQDVQIAAPVDNVDNKPIEIIDNTQPVIDTEIPATTEAVITQPVVEAETPVNTEAVITQPVVEAEAPVNTEAVTTQPVVEAEAPVNTEAVTTQPVVEAEAPVNTEAIATQPVVEAEAPVNTEAVTTQPVVETEALVNTEAVTTQPVVEAEAPVNTEAVTTQPVVETKASVNNETQPDSSIATKEVQVVKPEHKEIKHSNEAHHKEHAHIKGKITLDVSTMTESVETIETIELPQLAPNTPDNKTVENKPVENKAAPIKSDVVNNTVSPQETPANANAPVEAPVVEPVKITTAIKEALNRVINKVLDNVKSTKTASSDTDIMVKVSEEVTEIDTGINPKLLEKIQHIQNTSPEILKEVEVKVLPDVNVIQKLDNLLDKTLNNIKNLLVQELNQSDKTDLNIQKLDNILKQAIKPVLDNAETITDSKEIKINLPHNKVVLDNLVITPVIKDQSIPVARPVDIPPQTIQTPGDSTTNPLDKPQVKEAPKAEPPANPINKQILTANEALKNLSDKIKVTENAKTNPVEITKNPEAVKSLKHIAKQEKRDVQPPIQNQPQNSTPVEKPAQKPVINNTAPVNAGIDKNISTEKLNTLADQTISKATIQAKQSFRVNNNTEKDPIINKSENKTDKTNNSKPNSDLSTHNLFKFLMNSNQDPALIGLRSAKSVMFTDSAFNINNTNLPIRTKDEVVNQVIDKIRSSLNKSELTINLKPHNLGDVNVNISMQRGVLQASIVTETARAMESLKSGLDSLKQTLIESGINVDKIVVQTSEKSTFTGGNNPNNSDQQSNWYRDQQANTGQNPQDRSTQKDMDFSLFKQSQNGKHHRNTNTTHPNTNNKDNLNDTNSNNNTAKPESNYINTDTGRVNYRV